MLYGRAGRLAATHGGAPAAGQYAALESGQILEGMNCLTGRPTAKIPLQLPLAQARPPSVPCRAPRLGPTAARRRRVTHTLPSGDARASLACISWAGLTPASLLPCQMERSPLDPDEFEFDTEKMWAKALGHHRAGYLAGEMSRPRR